MATRPYLWPHLKRLDTEAGTALGLCTRWTIALMQGFTRAQQRVYLGRFQESGLWRLDFLSRQLDEELRTPLVLNEIRKFDSTTIANSG